jgi:hypothetical protein
MEKFIEGLLFALGVMAIVAVVAVLGGTVLYLIWPVAIPVVFPGLVESGVLADKLAWWPAVCFTWICGILIKSTQTNNNSK